MKVMCDCGCGKEARKFVLETDRNKTLAFCNFCCHARYAPPPNRALMEEISLEEFLVSQILES